VVARLHQLNGRRLGEIRPFAQFVDNPMDMEYGPDGALYVLGDGYFAENDDAQLAKINFVRGNHTPVVKAAATPTAGRSPLAVTFSSAGTADPDGDPITYAWDFEANGSVDSTAAKPTFTYKSNGTYRATLKVTDRTGRSAAAEVLVLVGNAKPVVELTTTPAEGGPFQFGDTVSFTVKVTDDTEVDCTKGHRRVRARPRDARSPAVLDRGLHGLDQDVPRRRSRRRGEPERRVRRLLHGSG
jgi:cytochrome c